MTVPAHVAIIMDGNGRWARKKKKPRSYGHAQGVRRVDEVVEAARKAGVKVLTLFAFSSENWLRPKHEINLLMHLLSRNLRAKTDQLNRANIRFCSIGRRQGAPAQVLQELDRAADKTKNNTGIVLNLAFNYGGRQEIVDAIQKICYNVQKGLVKPGEISEKDISQALYTDGLPDPDLLIRTSGEKRLSNFLLWQLSYSELYFTTKYWPEFTEKEFHKALKDFQSRERRYGKIEKSKGSDA